MKKILLIEPKYKTKYPPLGLMKIAAYHRIKGDKITFFKGLSPELRSKKWHRVYIATLFTYYWNETIKTIKYYKNSVSSTEDIFVGGVLATLLKNDILKEIDVTVIQGLLDKPGILGNDEIIIDNLIPDYSVLNSFNYPLANSYMAYATRGCKNKCEFCAVPILEPKFIDYIPFKKQVLGIKKIYGPKKDLLLLDNNVLLSKEFERIIDDIKDLGFENGTKYNNKLRFIDFNQGLDARSLDERKMKLLSEISIRPMRIAFDFIELKDIYVEKIRLAAEYEIVHLSNYILYNYKDTPLDLYKRLRINVLLNEELGTKIYSFPMKYIPIYAKDRRYISKHWNRKFIRTIQSILLATHGVVTTKRRFFEAAFGRNEEEFKELLLMPEKYIIERNKFKQNSGREWRKVLHGMTNNEKCNLISIIKNNKVTLEDFRKAKSNKVKQALEHYVNNKHIKGEVKVFQRKLEYNK